LGFSPQNLKFDGRFHTLKVGLTTKEKFSVQARHGYFAPRSASDPAEVTKEEIQEALFSQEEIHNIPIDLQTQYFKKDEAAARVAGAMTASLLCGNVLSVRAQEQPVLPPPPAAAPAQQSSVTIKKETKLVLVDAVVIDKKGNYVRDLTQNEFKVYEDNKEQAVS